MNSFRTLSTCLLLLCIQAAARAQSSTPMELGPHVVPRLISRTVLGATRYFDASRGPSEIESIVFRQFSTSLSLETHLQRLASGVYGSWSAHYLVALDGRIYRLIEDEDKAYVDVNVASRWRDEAIFVAYQTGLSSQRWTADDGTPTAQMQQLARLVRYLCQRYTVDRLHPEATQVSSGTRGLLAIDQISILSSDSPLDFRLLGARVSCPPPPIPVSPGATQAMQPERQQTRSDPVTFTWQPVQMSDHDLPSPQVVGWLIYVEPSGPLGPQSWGARTLYHVSGDGSTTSSTQPLPWRTNVFGMLTRTGWYRWRVKAYNAYGLSEASRYHYFYRASPGLPALTPVPTPPIIDRTIPLSWSTRSAPLMGWHHLTSTATRAAGQIDSIVLSSTALSADGLADDWSARGLKPAAHFHVGTDGRITRYIDERDHAWSVNLPARAIGIDGLSWNRRSITVVLESPDLTAGALTFSVSPQLTRLVALLRHLCRSSGVRRHHLSGSSSSLETPAGVLNPAFGQGGLVGIGQLIPGDTRFEATAAFWTALVNAVNTPLAAELVHKSTRGISIDSPPAALSNYPTLTATYRAFDQNLSDWDSAQLGAHSHRITRFEIDLKERRLDTLATSWGSHRLLATPTAITVDGQRLWDLTQELSVQTVYAYRLRAGNAFGYGPWSDWDVYMNYRAVAGPVDAVRPWENTTQQSDTLFVTAGEGLRFGVQVPLSALRTATEINYYAVYYASGWRVMGRGWARKKRWQTPDWNALHLGVEYEGDVPLTTARVLSTRITVEIKVRNPYDGTWSRSKVVTVKGKDYDPDDPTGGAWNLQPPADEPESSSGDGTSGGGETATGDIQPPGPPTQLKDPPRGTQTVGLLTHKVGDVILDLDVPGDAAGVRIQFYVYNERTGVWVEQPSLAMNVPGNGVVAIEMPWNVLTYMGGDYDHGGDGAVTWSVVVVSYNYDAKGNMQWRTGANTSVPIQIVVGK